MSHVTGSAAACGLQILLVAAAQATMPRCLPIQLGAATLKCNPKAFITIASRQVTIALKHFFVVFDIFARTSLNVLTVEQ